MDRFIVTIDGPAGSGKSTIAKLLAERDGFVHINSGALYRALAFALGESINEESIKGLDLELRVENSSVVVYIDGRDVTGKLSGENVGSMASKVAKLGFVRDYVNERVRELAKSGKFVIDGRDCGSVIFPYADVKIFLDADLKERARRRSLETGEDFDEVLKIIEKRDKQDRGRDIAPLVKPQGAYEVDTTGKGIEEVYNEVKNIIRRVYDNRNR